MKHKPLFVGVGLLYALGAMVANAAGSALEQTPASVETPGIMSWMVLSGMILAGLFVLLRLAWSMRSFFFKANRLAFAGMLLLTVVSVKVGATKSPQNVSASPNQPADNTSLVQTGITHVTPAQNLDEGQSVVIETTTLLREETNITPQPRVVTVEAAGVSLTTNFFAGRLFADPRNVASRDASHATLLFAPEQSSDDEDIPAGALFSFYDLPDVQAVVILASLDGLRAPTRATLLRATDLLVQQAEEDFNDPQTLTHCRFKPVGADRRMLVNNIETSFVPRDGWAVISIESGARPIDMSVATLGSDGNPRFGGAYWPGRIAEFVFIPRADASAKPVAWDDTLRNALESYLFHKHRFALQDASAIPPGMEINHAKMNLVENRLGLPRLKIHGMLLMVR